MPLYRFVCILFSPAALSPIFPIAHFSNPFSYSISIKFHGLAGRFNCFNSHFNVQKMSWHLVLGVMRIFSGACHTKRKDSIYDLIFYYCCLNYHFDLGTARPLFGCVMWRRTAFMIKLSEPIDTASST